MRLALRKRIINTVISPAAPETGVAWRRLDEIAMVEVTSEEASYPVENALLDSVEAGWRAALPGEQTIRLVFDVPRQLRRIYLRFLEREAQRLQEFVVRWSADEGRTFHEIVRQQWTFSPHGSTEAIEDYHVELSAVTQLELKITPDTRGGPAHATLTKLQLA
jgi:hypothetical protein